jgi:putative tryptophan/tyrosine transport system substrate-binding protein
MKKTVWTRSFDYSGNLKSKTCPEISRRSENLKQIGLAVIALVIVVTGTVAQAQTPKRIPRIGYLGGGSAELEKGWLDAFLQGLRELGYIEGKNIVVERRYVAGRYDRLTDLTAELVRLKVDVILAASTPVAHGAKRATATIPIVMVVADPVGTGLVSSLAQPGGNLTGLSDFHADLITKRLELLKDIVPSASRIAVLLNPANPTCSLQMKDLTTAASSLGVTLFSVEAKGPDDIAPIFSTMKKQRAGALLVCGDRMLNTHRTQIFDLTTENRLPAIYTTKEYADAGGLMSYGANFTELYHRAATYTDKILKGAKPADLPIEQPTKFELIINLKAANQIGLTIPPNVLARADRVIK